MYATPSTANGGKGLYASTTKLTGSSRNYYYLDTNFDVDTEYTLKTEVANGVLKIYYNGALAATESDLTRTTLYFKAGDYCQSWEDVDDLTDYCETEITSISFSHV